jgi:hypothetical protein
VELIEIASVREGFMKPKGKVRTEGLEILSNTSLKLKAGI